MAETTTKNRKRNINTLREEVKLLRSFLIGIAGKDKEGNYRQEFVRRVLKSAQEKERFVFKNKVAFLSRLQNK